MLIINNLWKHLVLKEECNRESILIGHTTCMYVYLMHLIHFIGTGNHEKGPKVSKALNLVLHFVFF